MLEAPAVRSFNQRCEGRAPVLGFSPLPAPHSPQFTTVKVVLIRPHKNEGKKNSLMLSCQTEQIKIEDAQLNLNFR